MQIIFTSCFAVIIRRHLDLLQMLCLLHFVIQLKKRPKLLRWDNNDCERLRSFLRKTCVCSRLIVCERLVITPSAVRNCFPLYSRVYSSCSSARISSWLRRSLFSPLFIRSSKMAIFCRYLLLNCCRFSSLSLLPPASCTLFCSSSI